jgi:adenine-specific DNA-methyltransferase
LQEVGIETSNLYSGFLALIIRLLEPGGVLCAICPRSFCNGPYFLPFRRLLTESMTLVRIHEFTARDRAFAGDAVLQETVIFTAVKRAIREPRVLLSHSSGPEEPISSREVPYSAVILPDDEARILHLPRTPVPAAELPCTLSELGVAVSTGRVVDFRAKDALRHEAAGDTVPLLYPAHLRNGQVVWPLPDFRKPQHIQITQQTQPQLLPAGRYVLVKRFSSKEQRRRVVAACCSPGDLPTAQFFGFENHLNVLSGLGESLPVALARGLCAFLNSTQLDHAFRLFSGHTQVNATDLRRLRFPNRAALLALGRALPRGAMPAQDELDQLVALHAGLPPHPSP